MFGKTIIGLVLFREIYIIDFDSNAAYLVVCGNNGHNQQKETAMTPAKKRVAVALDVLDDARNRCLYEYAPTQKVAKTIIELKRYDTTALPLLRQFWQSLVQRRLDRAQRFMNVSLSS